VRGSLPPLPTAPHYGAAVNSQQEGALRNALAKRMGLREGS
jgi:hypothetical protein